MSTTYSHHAVVKSQKKASKVSKSTPSSTTESQPSTISAAQALLFVKTYDPVSGTCLRIRISKSNQLSRVWAALGPKGVEIAGKGAVRGVAGVMGNDKRALDTAMTDAAVEETVKEKVAEGVTPSASEQPPTVSAGKGGKKNKNKKR